jgi:FkbM family methyltransferase
VYSFEPAPNTNKILNETVKINALQNTITVENYAMSSKKGSTVFFMANTNLADNANSLVNHRVDKKLNEVNVTLTSIDDFVIDKNLPKVDFIKIDAEGVEYDVLVGARKTLEKYKPKMTLGLHPTPIKQKGDSLEAIYDLLAGYNYNISLFGKTLTREDFIAQQDLFDVQLS